MSNHRKNSNHCRGTIEKGGEPYVFYPGEQGEASLQLLPTCRDMLMEMWSEEVSNLLALRPCSIETFIDHICHAVMKRMQLSPGEQELLQYELESLIEASPNLIEVLQDLLLYSDRHPKE